MTPTPAPAPYGALRKDHPCAAVFLDETGAIPNDRFFAVGVLKSSEPAALLRRLQKWRDRRHWYKELKFSDVTKGTLGLYKEAVDTCLTDPAPEFFCFVADRDAADPVERFGSHWAAYEKLAEQLIVACVHPGELVSVMADNYSTPDYVLFEEAVRSSVNRRLRRLAVVTVCRLDSTSSVGLQAVDLFTSAVAFEFRAAAGLASAHSVKGQLAAHVRASLGATSCLGGWRSRAHSVQVYHHGAWVRRAPVLEPAPSLDMPAPPT